MAIGTYCAIINIRYSVKMQVFNRLGMTALFLLGGLIANGQDYAAKYGRASFFSAASMENIEATNEKVNAFLIQRGDKKTIAVLMYIKDFKFANSLMQEHFNENYMESDKHPKATFQGSINEAVDLSKSGTYDVSATGKLSIHGVELERTLKGKLKVDGAVLTLDADFDVLLVDYKIERPSIMTMKIAEKIAVKLHVNFTEKRK